MQTNFHSGFVAILGRPNVGKSSIMNLLVGEKVAIVSDKPQTTRNKILGVMNAPDSQIVFVDTPGIHKPRTKLGEFMMKQVDAARDGVDCIMIVVDASRVDSRDLEIIEGARGESVPKFIVVNKSDLTPPAKLMPRLAEIDAKGYDQVITVSARRGDNIEKLRELLIAAMPEGPKYFPDDMPTDQPERLVCAEIIREKALSHLRDEVPHGIGVEMMSITKLSPTLTEIHATIYCEKDSHKGVIIGKGGAMLKTIGSEARVDIEGMMNTKILLKLWVKVRENWRDRAGDLKTLGYED